MEIAEGDRVEFERNGQAARGTVSRVEDTWALVLLERGGVAFVQLQLARKVWARS